MLMRLPRLKSSEIWISILYVVLFWCGIKRRTGCVVCTIYLKFKWHLGEHYYEHNINIPVIPISHICLLSSRCKLSMQRKKMKEQTGSDHHSRCDRSFTNTPVYIRPPVSRSWTSKTRCPFYGNTHPVFSDIHAILSGCELGQEATTRIAMYFKPLFVPCGNERKRIHPVSCHPAWYIDMNKMATPQKEVTNQQTLHGSPSHAFYPNGIYKSTSRHIGWDAVVQ